ncbi:hypothetical protein WA026_009262 [Henosepilachna vigintioctopunctata]|uniref:Uncharacterized protein n=1 Tax=Henosepilachna vigintioctopunctata TaxID=420089 RepID=A0AAW1UR81_9CUCU
MWKSKILLRLKSLIILIAVTCLSAATAFCPRVDIRSATLTLYTSSFPLRIENRRVVANMPERDEYSLLFIKDESLNLLLYDPRAMHFICWNPKRTKLVAKRNPTKDRIKLCSFREEASKSMPLTLRNYVSSYNNKQVMIKMSPRGHYASKQETRTCEKKRKFSKIKKNCHGSGEFLLSGCSDGRRRFCDVIKTLRKSRGILHELKMRHCENT